MNTHVTKALENTVRTFIEVQNAFLECNPEIQQVIKDMLEICHDPDADEDEKEQALTTIVVALFPSYATDLEQMARTADESSESQAYERRMDREEAEFAQRLRRLMKKKRITQKALAEKTGVGQPAISNMVNRRCRPQQRTVARFAEALEVSVEELWPNARE